MPENPATDETRLFLSLALDCLEEAAAIICGRTYGYGVAGSDLERAGQAMKELLETLDDARWVLTDPERWQALQTELRTQAAEADQACPSVPALLLVGPDTQEVASVQVATLTLLCPFCQHGHNNDLECLDSGRLEMLHCQNPRCNKDFAFLLHECLACVEESVFTWTRMPALEALAGLSCQHCGAQFHDEARYGESKDAAQRI